VYAIAFFAFAIPPGDRGNEQFGVNLRGLFDRPAPRRERYRRTAPSLTDWPLHMRPTPHSP